MNRSETAHSLFEARWALVPWVLLGLLLCIQCVLYMLSNSDPGFAVEPDYYAKAVNWDAERASARRGQSLGYELKLDVSEIEREQPAGTLTMTIRGPAGAAVAGHQVQVTAFHNGRSGERQMLSLSEAAPGVYAAPFRLTREGLWAFRVSAKQGTESFTQKVEKELAFAR